MESRQEKGLEFNMKNILLELRTSFINKGCKIPDFAPSTDWWGCGTGVKSTSEGEKRLEEFQQGFESILIHEEEIIKHADIVVSDNTTQSQNEIDSRILPYIPRSAKFNCAIANKYGAHNKGAGLVDFWGRSKKILERYEWLLYFEPRLTLRKFDLMESFFKKNRTIFTYPPGYLSGMHPEQFNTGLFAANVKDILKYVDSTDLKQMVLNAVSIEDSLLYFYKKHKIEYDILPEMGVTWHDSTVNRKINM